MAHKTEWLSLLYDEGKWTVLFCFLSGDILNVPLGSPSEQKPEILFSREDAL